MNSIQLCLPAPSRVQSPFSQVSIVALYDSMASAAYANEAIGSIAIAGHPEIKVESQMWSFDMLTRLDIRHASLRPAVEADVFVIAAAASSTLPAHVSSWVNVMFREHRQGAPVLVAIYEDDFRQAYALPSLRRELQTIAARWRTPLLCNRELHTCLDRELRPNPVDCAARNTSSFDLETLLTGSAPSRWGINE